MNVASIELVYASGIEQAIGSSRRRTCKGLLPDGVPGSDRTVP